MRDYKNITMINVQKKTILDYIYSNTAQKFTFILFLASVFVFGLMYGYGEIESPKVFWLMALMLIYYIFDPNLKSNPIDLPFLLLCAVTFLIAVWQKMDNPVVNGMYDPTPYAWIMPSVYLLGNLVVGNNKGKLEKRVLCILLALGIGMYIQGLLNYAIYFIDDVPSLLPYRPYNGAWHSFWNLDVDGTRNNWNNGFFVLSGGLFYAIIDRKNKKLLSITIFATTVFCLALNLAFRGRTMLVFLILELAILALLYIMRNNTGNYKKIKRILLVVAMIMLLGLILIFAASKLFVGQDTMWTRDGGILNNVRLNMWRGGLAYMFSQQKGGWSLDESIYLLQTPHNLWLEFGRHYDIIIFFVWIAFLLSIFVVHGKVFLQSEGKFPVVYFGFGISIIMFLFTMVEPIYILNQDLILFYLFILGIISGIGRVTGDGDYIILSCQNSTNEKRYLFVGFGLLLFAFMANVYQDWWADRLRMTAVLFPLIGYILGGIRGSAKYQKIILYALSTLSIVLAIITLAKSVNTDYFKAGFCIEPFSSNVVEMSVLLAFIILPASLLLGLVFYKIKISKTYMTIITTVVTCVLLIPHIRDGRLSQIKEALRLQLGMKNGSQWIASKENVTGIITSHCMWLDYARDYGMLTLGLLIVFETWSIYCLFKLIKKKERCYIDYVLIVAFILFNYHFLLEATAMTSIYIFAAGLIVYGLISTSIVPSKNQE